MTKELLHKFLNNQCTSEEFQEVADWINTDGPLIDGERWTFEEWQSFKADKQYRTTAQYQSMLGRIHSQIIFEQLTKEKRVIRKKVPMLTWVTRAAAVLLLPTTIFLLLILSQHNFELTSMVKNEIDTMEVVAPEGSKTRFLLSDGTEVFLNHDSSLKYPKRFSKKKREVILSGEGYFKVAHNPKHPFEVKTRNLNTVALRTEFNVLAYPGEKMAEVTLVNGKVAVEKITEGGELKMLGEMVSGQHITYHISEDKVTGGRGSVAKNISWIEGRLIFRNDPIDQIASRLSRWYNVEFEFADDEVKKYTYTATFMDETLVQVLDLMSIAAPVSYRLEAREKLSDGTFTKQKVTIYLKR